MDFMESEQVMKPTWVCLVLLFALLGSSSTRSNSQASSAPNSFIIDPNRAYVYLHFDHIGKGVKFSDDEPRERLWFRFVNNCRVGIVLRTFGPPDGVPANEAGVMDNVVKDAPILEIRAVNDPSTPKSSDQEKTKMPVGYGYGSDVSSTDTVAPGKSIQFSVPINHLGKSWHIEIPFKFELPPGKCCRPTMIGGEPQMVLFYSVWDLPPDIQKQVLGTR